MEECSLRCKQSCLDQIFQPSSEVKKRNLFRSLQNFKLAHLPQNILLPHSSEMQRQHVHVYTLSKYTVYQHTINSPRTPHHQWLWCPWGETDWPAVRWHERLRHHIQASCGSGAVSRVSAELPWVHEREKKPWRKVWKPPHSPHEIFH